MATPPLNEQLYGLFYDVFKRVGIALNIDQLDSLRATTDKITKSIQDEIKDGMKKVATIAISEMKLLEERVGNGQKKIEETGDNKGTSDTIVSIGDDDRGTS